MHTNKVKKVAGAKRKYYNMSQTNITNSREFYKGHPDVVRIGSNSLSYIVYIKSLLSKDTPVRVKLNEYDHIEALKRRLSRKIGIPTSCQNFLFKGQILKAGTAKQNGLYPGCIVTLCPIIEAGLMDNPHNGPSAPLIPMQSLYQQKSISLQLSRQNKNKILDSNNKPNQDNGMVYQELTQTPVSDELISKTANSTIGTDINNSKISDVNSHTLSEVDSNASIMETCKVNNASFGDCSTDNLLKTPNSGRYRSSSITSSVDGDTVSLTESVQSVTIAEINRNICNKHNEKLEQNTRKKMDQLRRKMIENKRARAQRAVE